MKKNAQVNAAILIAIIAAIVILYIIFSPNRLEIIGENETHRTYDSDNDDDDLKEEILLLEHPERLDYIEMNEIEHTLPTINLFTKTEGTILKRVDSIYVKNGMFDKADGELEFEVPDADNTKNVMLTFNAGKRKGRLMIKLNDEDIFNNQIATNYVNPIQLPKDRLRDMNSLEFSVSSVGFRFWATNEYLLEDLKIAADVTDTGSREATSVFIVSDSEQQNIDKAKLRFYADCDPHKVSPISITINGNQIFSGVPDCGMPTNREFSPFYLFSGENKIKFEAEKGQYLLDNIMIQTKLKDSPSYVNYFEIEEEQWDDIEDDELEVNMTLRFIDDEEDKEADIFINGKKTRLPLTQDKEFTKRITSLCEEGTNAIKITPRTTLDIKDLEIRLSET